MWLYPWDGNISTWWEAGGSWKSLSAQAAVRLFFFGESLGQKLRKPGGWDIRTLIASFRWWGLSSPTLMQRKPEPPFSAVRPKKSPKSGLEVCYAVPPFMSVEIQEDSSQATLYSPRERTIEWLLFHLLLQLFQIEGRCWILLYFFLTYVHVHILYGYKDTGDMASLTVFSWGVLAKARLWQSLQRQLYKTHITLTELYNSSLIVMFANHQTCPSVNLFLDIIPLYLPCLKYVPFHIYLDKFPLFFEVYLKNHLLWTLLNISSIALV